MTVAAALLAELVARARATPARADDPAQQGAVVRQRASVRQAPLSEAPARPAPPGTPSVLSDRPDATVVRYGPVVAKAHAAGTDREELAARLAVAGALPGVLLAPLEPVPTELHGRPVTYWPYGAPVDPGDPDAVPWEAAAVLLARLHRTPVPSSAPPAMRGPRKAARAVEGLRSAPGVPAEAARPVLDTWAALPAWARGEEPGPGPVALCHGDFHLGQLVRHPAPGGPWRLIDVDDLGPGVPAWDLARPAAWFACGLLDPEDWARFLHAYRAEGGPALPPEGDPWGVLDVPARALTAQTAARALTKAAAEGRPLDGTERAMVDACARIVAVRGELERTDAA